MEFEFSGKSGIDVHINNGEKCFLTANTTDYNCDGNCGVVVGGIEEMIEYGWCDKEDIKKLNSLEIGERYDSEDYGTTVFVIRLG